MEVKDYFIFLVFGKIAIFFLQTFPPLRQIKWKFLQEALDCSLCTGFWVFTTLCFVFKVNLVEPYFLGVSEILTGAISSLLVYLVSIGWKSQYQIVNFSNTEE